MPSPSRVFVAGSTTMAGTALVRRFGAEPVTLVGLGPDEPDLRDPGAVDRFFATARPDAVIVTAGAQAGIAGNQRRPADLLTDNLLVAAAVIPAAVRHGVARLLYLASSCIYPKAAPQPFTVGSLWTGPVEPTSAAFG
jgi:GDP-L-fucose synthase